MPRDPRLARVCRAILADPARGDDLDRWATLAGMGRRTLTRHFREQTGMGLAEWRQQVRLFEAVARLEMGQSVTSVAFDVGYESLSAFATVFQKRFGRPPSRFGGRAAHQETDPDRMGPFDRAKTFVETGGQGSSAEPVRTSPCEAGTLQVSDGRRIRER